jgi:hypothetical protein
MGNYFKWDSGQKGHAASHENDGADEISVAGLSGELADAQTPKTHASSHQSGGADAIKLDDLAAPDDNTDLDASASKHGLLPKLPNDDERYLRGDGVWGSMVFLTTPLTSTSWDGDARSTTSKTLIDLSAVFGVPAAVRAVLVYIQARDSASSSTPATYFGAAPNNTDLQLALSCKVYPMPNDIYTQVSGLVPCDANGDIYYQCGASGSGTLDVFLQVWGYVL